MTVYISKKRKSPCAAKLQGQRRDLSNSVEHSLPNVQDTVNAWFCLLAETHAGITRTRAALVEGQEQLDELADVDAHLNIARIHQIQRRRERRLTQLQERVSAIRLALRLLTRQEGGGDAA